MIDQKRQSTEIHDNSAQDNAFGVAALNRALQGVDFPASKQQVLEQVQGNPQIPWTKYKTIDLRSLIQQTSGDQINNVTDVFNTLNHSFISNDGEDEL